MRMLEFSTLFNTFSDFNNFKGKQIILRYFHNFDNVQTCIPENIDIVNSNCEMKYKNFFRSITANEHKKHDKAENIRVKSKQGRV